MADGTIDSISIEIGASSTKAVESIKNISTALNGLKESMKRGNGLEKFTKAFKDLSEALKSEGGETFDKINSLARALNNLKGASDLKLSNKLPDQLRNIGKAVSEVSDDTVRKLNDMTTAIERLRGIDLKGFSSAVKAAQKASKQVNALQVVKNGNAGGGLAPMGAVGDQEISDIFSKFPGGKTGSGARGAGAASPLKKELQLIGQILKSNIGPAAKMFGNALKNAYRYAQRIAKSILSFAGKTIKGIWDKSAFAGLEKSLSRIKKVISSFERIAFYRAIRSAIKYVTDALKEGTENAYWYSKEFGDATKYISEAYDEMASKNFKMSNQLGAAWATMIAYVEPIIIRIINLVTKAADAITQFFALMSGKGTYLKAVDYAKDWAEATDEGSKAAKEWRNQLMGFDEINRLEEPSDGSGSSKSKKPTDYGNMFVESPVNDFFADIRKAFESGEWAELGRLLGERFNDIVNMVDWKGYGKKLGQGLQNTITVAYNFLKTADFKNLGALLSEFINNAMKEVDFTQLGQLWMRMRTALWDVIYGAVIRLNWSDVAVSLSNFIIGALTELSDWLKTLDPVEIANALKDFFGNIKYEEIAEKIKEVLKTALGLVGDVIGELLPEDIGPNFKDGIVNAIKEADFAAIHNVLSYKLDEAVFGKKWADFWWSKGDYAGKELVMSLIKGVDLEKPELETAMKNGIENPTDTSLANVRKTTKEHLDGILADSDLMIEGFHKEFDGLTDFLGGVFTLDWSRAWSGIVEMMSGSVQTIAGWAGVLIDSIASAISWIRGLFEHMNALASSNAARIEADGSIYLTGYATGGFPEDGLFMANHGEMVGKFSNGKTAVANNDQITSGIADAVYEAFMSAFSQTGSNGGNEQPINIYLDGRMIGQSTTKYQNQRARAMG